MRQEIQYLQTPAFLVDRQRLVANCDRMLAKTMASGVGFRPHVKTHKTIEAAKLQHGGAVGPITVSTLAEARFFGAAGFDDITYAVPIAPEKLARAAEIASRIRRLNILVDHPDLLFVLEAFYEANKVVFDVFLKIDCGYHRAGLPPDSASTIALLKALASSPAVRFQGLLTHAGHSYNAANRAEVVDIALSEAACLTRITNEMHAGGLDLTRSIGSTPTACIPERIPDTDEIRPGNYVFFDAFQATIGSCTLADCAASVLTTVVGSYHDHLIVDAGALALSKDPGATQIDPACGFGVVCDAGLHPVPLKLTALSQEHGRMEGADAGAFVPLPIGTVLRVIPNHSCLTAAMFDRYYVLEEGNIVDEWRPVRGW